MKRSIGALVMVSILAAFLALRYAAAVEARQMLHPCPVGEGEYDYEGSLHDQECGAHTPVPTNTPTSTNTSTNTPTSTSTNTPTNTPPPVNTLSQAPANTPTPTNTPSPTPTKAREPVSARPQEPCVVAHAATPLQLCLTAQGFEYFFIGPGGVESGPLLPSISELAEIHPAVLPVVELYRGANPMTGKPVTIDYLPAENRLRVSTFYADRPPHDIDKPYVFTVDADHNVVHEQW